MAFHLATSWKERGLQLQGLKDRCNSIIGTLDLPDDDARIEALVQVRQLCNTLALVPIKLQQNSEIRSNVPVIMALLGMQEVSGLKSVLGDLNKNAKLSFITMCQFSLENCVYRILASLSGRSNSARFSEESERLIRLAGLDRPADKHQLILVPAWIRNTLHSGGIHKRSSNTVVVDGEPYRFVNGEQLQCGTWSHLFHAVLRALDVYAEILASSPVVAIRHVELS
ncbi:MAG: hypothetical protein V3S55_08545 [Nitrospiraceae bacterium]